MGYHRRYKKRSYQRSYYSWDDHHAKERKRVSDKYGNADDDTRQIFLNLSENSLAAVLDEYGKQFGAKKRSYAKSTFYKKWKDGSCNMSGEVAERILGILPKFLNFDQQYALLEKIWHARTRVSLVINVDAETSFKCNHGSGWFCLANNIRSQVNSPTQSKGQKMPTLDCGVKANLCHPGIIAKLKRSECID